MTTSKSRKSCVMIDCKETIEYTFWNEFRHRNSLLVDKTITQITPRSLLFVFVIWWNIQATLKSMYFSIYINFKSTTKCRYSTKQFARWRKYSGLILDNKLIWNKCDLQALMVSRNLAMKIKNAVLRDKIKRHLGAKDMQKNYIDSWSF